MKKIFSEKMASVYGWLLVLCIVGFIAVIVILIKFSYLPMRLTPISYMPIPLFFAGIIFGILAILSYWKVNVYSIVALVVIIMIGIPLMAAGNFLYAGFQEIFIQNNTVITAVVANGRWERNFDLGYDIVVVKSFCIHPQTDWISPSLIVDVYEGTKIYELDTASQQKRQVGIEALQPGRVVNIKFKDFLSDPEIDDRLFAKYDPRGIDTQYLIGAIEITIQKDKYDLINTSIVNSVCEILPEQ